MSGVSRFRVTVETLDAVRVPPEQQVRTQPEPGLDDLPNPFDDDVRTALSAGG